MVIRNKQGKLVIIEKKNFKNDYLFYKSLLEILF